MHDVRTRSRGRLHGPRRGLPLWATQRAVVFAKAIVMLSALATVGLEPSEASAQADAPISGTLQRLRAPGPQAPVLGHGAATLAGLHRTEAREQERFWAWDFHLERYYVVEASLRHVSPTAWIYSEDGADVSGVAVARLAETFEDRVAPELRKRYGHEPSPGVDGQTAVTLLLLDVRDSLYHDQAPYTYVSGYFDPGNQSPAVDVGSEAEPPEGGRASNGREMLYLDVDPTDPEGPILGQTVAHEFAHLIGWAFDPEEEAWLSEGLAQLAIHICDLGHPREQLMAFLAEPETPLLEWRGEVRDYGKVYAWMLYLYEQLDGGRSGALQAWIRDPADGMASVLAAAEAPRSAEELLRDFGMALHFDDVEHGDGRYGFRALTIVGGATLDGPSFPPPVAHVHDLRTGGGDPESEPLAPWTVRGDRFRVGGAEAEIVLDPGGPICLGAGWREAAGRGPADQLEATCLRGARPASWLHRAAAGADLRTVIAHIGPETVHVHAQAAPPAGTRSRGPGLYLPMLLRR